MNNNADSVLSPREIFNALPKNNAIKFQYPRDVQSQVWSKWFERRNEKNLVVKMNTGSGKTAVGLLILKSCINEKKVPVAYFCPDNYLVQQVIDTANELGIDVTEDVNNPRFLTGKSILVTNIYKLVNGRSKFGIGDEGEKISLGSFIIDDAHACLDTIEDQFTLSIKRDEDLFAELYGVFKESLHKISPAKALELESEDPNIFIQVPYWIWQSKLSEVNSILVKSAKSKSLEFVWPLLKEDLKLCNCVISRNRIEISPHCIPIHMIPTIENASRRIFMTATLSDDSILSSLFGVQEHDISAPITPDSAGDIGDRMILMPQVINTNTTDDEIKNYCKHMAQYMNVVVIVPSERRSRYWSDVAKLTLTASNLYEGVERLKKEIVGLTVLINKYDGVDLPGNACRLLVIDGLPNARSLIDKVQQGVLMGSKRNTFQTIQTIEQGMGRGIRSNDDYCTIFLMGRDLTNKLYSNNALDMLSPGTRAQLNLSEQVSSQIQNKPFSDIHNVIMYCLSRNVDWVRASKGCLINLTYSDHRVVDKGTVALRKAYDYASRNAISSSISVLNDFINTVDELRLKGFYKQVLAEYTNITDVVNAQKIQLSAISDNNKLLKPIEGIVYNRITTSQRDQASQCREEFSQYASSPNKLIIKVNAILDALQFAPDSSNSFEEAFKEIARYIGFDSQRPEDECGKGPDGLWMLGALRYFVIECKNEAVAELISKTYCNQLNGSCNWFMGKYDHTCTYTPIIIHPSTCFEYAASPNPLTRIMNIDCLNKFKNAVHSFICSIVTSSELNNETAIRNKLLSYKLRPDDIIGIYTEPYKTKTS
ncbi:DEAD/DEAH box helicase [Aeromonas veronii]|uniref:DEAD/DEAH box helicase n=1 Tax=Aeromonas veronii TaxID=654 RepID=UPI003B9F7171